MENHFKPIKHEFSASKPLFFLLVLILLPACSEKKMTLEEAKQVSVSLRQESMVPPPRRINDILSVLDQTGNFDSESIQKLKLLADEVPGDIYKFYHNRAQRVRFFRKRGEAALQLGRYQQNLNDLRSALHWAETSPGRKNSQISTEYYARILQHLGIAETRSGNFLDGLGYIERSLKIQPTTVRYYLLTLRYLEIGDTASAEKTAKKGVAFSRARISGGKASVWDYIGRERLKISLLEARGQFSQAEPHIRAMVEYTRRVKSTHPLSYIHYHGMLAENLAYQGRFIEAEIEIRKTLEEVIGFSGANAGATAEILSYLGKILILQGRFDEAQRILQSAIHMLQGAGLRYDSTIVINLVLQLCRALVADRNFNEAMQQFDHVRFALQDNHFFYEKKVAQNPNLLLTLLKSGRVNEAMEIIVSVFKNYRLFFGDTHYRTAEMLCLRAMVHAINEDRKSALKDFAEGIPRLFAAQTESEINYLKKQRIQILIESYLHLLGNIYQNNLENTFAVDVPAESFKLAQMLIDSTVQQSLGATSAQKAITNPDLANLVRKEQDALRQIQAIQGAFLNAMAVPPAQQNQEIVSTLKERAAKLRQARSALLDEIQNRFPKYTEFITPQPITLGAVQKYLRSHESILLIIPTDENTFIWTIPSKGPVAFAISDLNRQQLHYAVRKIRKAFDAKAKTFGEIPDYNFELAFNLYDRLIEPVKDGWKNARDLTVIVHGPLALMPLSALPTKPIKLVADHAELFSSYRRIPWLIREVSITRQPSVSAFVMLRKLPTGDPDRIAFAGFGDPVYSLEQLAEEEVSNQKMKADGTNQQKNFQIRGIRLAEQGNLDNKNILSVQLTDLKRLPETAQEIKSIASALKCVPDRDIFLRARASEGRVKSMDLSNRRIIAFASHALVSGDLDGLNQPAIALSAPQVTGEDDDGLLTMEEVMKLNLNTDWVLLSGCNSGASYGRGAEVLSGLGQAFFYAGTRAILVSLWSVETTSAQLLTTGVFRNQQSDKSLSRARALQQSILDLIDGPGLTDQSSGKIIASYAHPLFWAPFILVGSGS
jgi:CHAT domain-containing protein